MSPSALFLISLTFFNALTQFVMRTGVNIIITLFYFPFVLLNCYITEKHSKNMEFGFQHKRTEQMYNFSTRASNTADVGNFLKIVYFSGTAELKLSVGSEVRVYPVYCSCTLCLKPISALQIHDMKTCTQECAQTFQ